MLAGLIGANPADNVDVPRLERDEQRFLTFDEVRTLADTIEDPYGPLVHVGAHCGLRIGELAGLRRGRVDLLARTIDVVEIVTEDVTLGGPVVSQRRIWAQNPALPRYLHGSRG